jgi:hypothetical protein
MRPPVPQEAPSLRMSAIMQPVLFVIVAVNLALQLRAPHVDTGIMTLRYAAIADFFIVIPILPIVGYFIWQRFERARATPASVA